MNWGTFPAAVTVASKGNVRFWFTAIPAAWVILVTVGFAVLLMHDTEATPTSVVDRSTQRVSHVMAQELGFGGVSSRIVMAVHPRCPCTSNSLDELQLATMDSESEANVSFLVYKPEDAPDSWNGKYIERLRKRFRDATIIKDPSGHLASRLDLHTSGALVVVRDGEILFRGGITAGRSCQQANLGSLTLREFLDNGNVSKSVETPVFGCKLDNDAS